MTADEPSRADQIASRLSGMRPEDRARFLDEQCGDDARLRAEVESHLSGAADQDLSFLWTTGDGSRVGETLGHYRITGEVGRGGMGVVYAARDLKLDRLVALKMLPEVLAADPERRERFDREARAIAAINHPNIVTVHSIEEADRGAHFITMELIEGEILAERVPDGGVGLDELLSLAIPLADAVGAAHERSITHRDLKPANVMVTHDGGVKVLDFGLARQAGPSTPEEVVVTAEGRVVGTVAYMSPEQAQGQPVDVRTDVFSLGIVLYELATGTRPFRGSTSMSVLTAIIRDAPTPVTELKASLPREFERILKRCLAKDPTRRYQSAIGLRNDLELLREEWTAGALASTGDGPESAPSRRVGWTGIALGILAVTALITVVAVVFDRGLDDRALGHVTLSRITEAEGIETDPTIAPDGKMLAYVATDGDDADIFLIRVGGRNATNLTADSTADDRHPAFSPDGERIAFRSERDGGGVFVMGATGESVRRLSDIGFHPAWSPDGERLVVCTERITEPGTRFLQSELWSIDVRTGAKARLTRGDAVQPSWSPSGRRIAFWAAVRGRRDIWTMSAVGGDRSRVTDDAAKDWTPVWSPDGRYLYFASDRSGVMNLWRIAVDETSGRPTGPPEAVTTSTAAVWLPSVSGDGRSIAYRTYDRSSDVLKFRFDPSAGGERVVGEAEVVAHHGAEVAQTGISGDGARFAFTIHSPHEDVVIGSTTGGRVRQLTSDVANDRRPRFSPDGERIVFYSNRSGSYEIWRVHRDGSGLTQLTDTPEYSLTNPCWSPDGKRIAFGCEWSKNRRDSICTIAADAPARRRRDAFEVVGQGRHMVLLSWSPDGKAMVVREDDERAGARGIAILALDGSVVKRFPDLTGDDAAWFPDSRRLLARRDDRMCVVDTATAEVRPLALPPGRDAFALTRDGKTLFIEQHREAADVWLLRFTDEPSGR